ncbi:hypothetical protein ACMD2_14978 [Ananas comosus]|uniref:MULE transposase domain-containing protein n=1 Tax=Ananas comosus TaxID=4615 RepID=A0A199VRQ0_ANACO|nr:hypothetical protein ACMD2_14978 [Ananas comosus]
MHSGSTAGRYLDWIVRSCTNKQRSHHYINMLHYCAFLSGKFRGALLTASFVQGENRYSWDWFLEQLRDGVVGDRGISRANSILTIVSDRQKGLIEAVFNIFPDAAQGYCMYHLSTNLSHAPKNTPAWKRFWAVARAYTVAEFNEHMEKIKDLNPEQYCMWWATHCFLGRRYSMLTSNCVETINSVIRHLKGLPITYLVEEVSRFYTLNPSTDRWDIDGIPYNHAMGAISCRLWDPYDFVEDWFKTMTYRATYNDYVPLRPPPHQRQRALASNTKHRRSAAATKRAHIIGKKEGCAERVHF